MNEQQKEKRFRLDVNVLSVIVTAAVTLLVAYGTGFLETGAAKYQSQLDAQSELIATLSARVERLEQAQERDRQIIATQQREISEINGQLVLSRAREAKLLAQLDEQLDIHEVFSAAINAINHPVWIQRVVVLDEPNEYGDLVEFRMWEINDSYATSFCVPRHLYIGNLDHQVWLPHEARQFQANNLLVWETKRALQTVELLRESTCDPDSPEKAFEVGKNLFQMPRSGEWFILGYSFPRN